MQPGPAHHRPQIGHHVADLQGQIHQGQEQEQEHGMFIRKEDRLVLKNLRVVRRTLVYAIGLSPNFAQVNTLKQPEYFGQYGEITKLVINHHRGVGSNDPRHGSASAYITFRRSEDAWAAICSVDGFRFMGRTIRASFGTSKYCHSFLFNLACKNPGCLYLHELGEQDDRFTKGEVQLGLSQHGFRFGFKEEVLRDRTGTDLGGGGGGSNGGRCVPTNPVFPPPHLIPTAPYSSEDIKHEQEGGLHHRHHTPPSPSAYAGYAHENHVGGGGWVPHPARSFGLDARRTITTSTASRPSLQLGAGLGGDGQPRQRSSRGRRGRGGGGNREEGEGNDGGIFGLGVEVHDEYGERLAAPKGGQEPAGSIFVHSPDNLSAVPSLEHFFEYDGESSNDHLHHPVPESTRTFGGSDNSTGSGESSRSFNSSTWEGKNGSPVLTQQTRRITPPLGLSQIDGIPPTSTPAFSVVVGGGGRPAATDHRAAGVRTRLCSLGDYHRRQQRQLLQLQRLKQLYEENSARMTAAQNLLATTQDRQDSELRQPDQRSYYYQQQEEEEQQERYTAGNDNHTTLAALQLQVPKIQRSLENSGGGAMGVSNGGGDGGGGGSATLIPPSLGIPDSCGPVGSARSISGELSCLGDYLSHLSCGKDEYETTTTAASSTQSFSQHLHGAAGPAAVANGESNVNLQGEQDWKEDATALAVVPSALTGFGSSALASAASQAEMRRSTPRLLPCSSWI